MAGQFTEILESSDSVLKHDSTDLLVESLFGTSRSHVPRPVSVVSAPQDSDITIFAIQHWT